MATFMKTGGAWIKSLTAMFDAKFANINLAKIIIENTLKLANLFFVTFLWSMVTKKFLWGTLVVATKRRWPLASGTYWDDGIRMHTFAWRNPMKPQSEYQPIRFWRMDTTDVIGEVYTSVAILMIGLILPAYGYTSYPYAVYLTMGSLWLIGTASNMKDPDVTWIEIIYDLGFVLWMMSAGGVGGSNSFLFGADPFMLGATGRITLHFAVRPVLHWLNNLKQDSDYGKNEEETVEASQVSNTTRVVTRAVDADDEEDADADADDEDNEAPV